MSAALNRFKQAHAPWVSRAAALAANVGAHL